MSKLMHFVDVVPEEFRGGLYDLSLFPLYANYAAKHLWDVEINFICIYSLKHMCYNISFLMMIYFSAVS